MSLSVFYILYMWTIRKFNLNMSLDDFKKKEKVLSSMLTLENCNSIQQKLCSFGNPVNSFICHKRCFHTSS